MKVRLGAGGAVEHLVAAMAVADADWRPVFETGAGQYADALAAGGRDLVRDATRIGRLGWANLFGPLTQVQGAWTVVRLRALVAGLDADVLADVVTGGRRRQPTQPAAWLRRATPAEIQRTCLRAIDGLPEPAERRASELTAIRARLRDVGPEALLAEVAPGVRYETGMLGDVVLVTSVRVAPIIIEVGEVGRTVIVHPPWAGDDGRSTEAGGLLREIGRAVGDPTRLLLLQHLRQGPRSLPELCVLMGAPRTTLLHHLALLRGAGLIDLSVSAGDPNIYALRAAGFEELARAASAFPLQG
jgi:DNA-binding transcriptional ArsR family regulator